ncbi:MAG: alpha/beta hydrolase [Flavobacteriales bacterium]|nr:alpha/beta hydrolase [Flavobacteriales bacterium]
MKALASAIALAIGFGTAGAARAQSAAAIPFGESRTFVSESLSEERHLNILLPEGYSPDSAARYPVIYLLDGGTDEDFIHIAGLVQFASFPWVDWLSPSIVVGIANVDRKRDFTHPTSIVKDKADYPTTGGSAAFLRFLGDELIPYIDSTYRTSGERMLIGQSLGGLFGAEVLFTQPELFTRYLLVSPSLWWDDASVLKRAVPFLILGASVPSHVFIAVGKEGKAMVGGAKRLAALLKRNKSITVGFHYMPKEDHGTILHQAAMNGLRWMSAR